MKKVLVALLMLAMIFAFAACNNDQGNEVSDTDIEEPVASETDIKDYDSLNSLPKYSGAGEIQYPWEDNTSGFWVSGATIEDMQQYGEKLISDGWTLNESVADYDAAAILYYTSKDGSQALQLKLMGEEYIRVTVGAPEDVEGLE